MAEPYTMPSVSHIHTTATSSTKPNGGREKTHWQTRLASSLLPAHHDSHETHSRQISAVQASTWWKIDLFRGMANDIKRRAPYYWSDWKDAWDYRVVPASVYMYFAKQVIPMQLSWSSY